MTAVGNWFDDFVVETRVAVTDYVNRITHSREDAKDVVQEAYLKVYCCIRNNPGEHQPVALLYTTARNLALSGRRHQKVVDKRATAVGVAEELRASPRSTEHRAGRREQLQMLLLAVNKLPPKCRSAFVLRVIDGLSQQEIAERLGISVSTVEKHLSRGLRLCRAEIASLESSEAPAVTLRRDAS